MVKKHTDDLSAYVREINRTPLLSAKDEKRLAKLVATGDMEARDLLIRGNLRLVISIARNYIGKGVGFSDLIEDGNLGLIRAAEGFDPSYDTRFSTYATYWITQSIKRSIVNNGRLIRVPVHVFDTINRWNKTKAALIEMGNENPTDKQILKAADISERQFEGMKSAQRLTRLVNVVNEEGETESVVNTLVANEQEVYSSEETDIISKLIDRLPPREAHVIRMRFGMGYNESTLSEIGKSIGVTRERARQIEAKAIVNLKELVAQSGIL